MNNLVYASVKYETILQTKFYKYFQTTKADNKNL